MPSSYTTSLRLTLPATGELAGQWGNTVNTGITELLDAAVAGTTTISTWGGAGVSYTLSNNSGSADEARRMFIVATGTPGEAKNVICPAVSKFYVFRNDTTGGFALTLKTPSGTGVSVPAGQYRFLYCDGTNVVEMFNSVASLRLSSLTSGRVTYAGSAGLLQDSANFTFNGTDLTVSGAVNAGSVNATTLDLTNLEVTNIKAKDGTASMTLADATGVATFSANPILNAGTANGVLYLNGSKVATSGSALTYNGTTLTADTSSTTAANFRIENGTYNRVGSFRLTTDGVQFDSFDQNNAASTRQFMWLSGGSEQMRLTSTGLGIGTTSPQFNLDLQGASGVGLRIYETSTGNNNRLQITQNGTVATYNNTYSTGSGVHAWQIGNAEFMRLDASGNLGISTATVTAKLDVVGGNGDGIQYRTGTRSVGIGQVANEASLYWGSGTALTFFGGSERMRLDSSGNLGIGTSSPGYRLDVSVGTNTIAQQWQGAGTGFNLRLRSGNGATAFSSVYRLYMDYLNGANLNGYLDFYRGNDGATGYLVFGTAGSDRMTLDASGNLGIGTSSPGQRLEVANTGASFAAIKFTNSAASGGIVSYSNDAFLFYTGNTERMRLDASGNLGIGTSSPVSALGFGEAASATGVTFQSTNTTFNSGKVAAIKASVLGSGNGSMLFETYAGGSGGGERMRLDSSGNLGLGVTPSASYSNSKNIELAYALLNSDNQNGAMSIAAGAYESGNTVWTYKNTGLSALRYQQSTVSGAHAWYTAPSGTAGNAISFTQAMTLDASGNLGIGTSSPLQKLHVATAGNNYIVSSNTAGSTSALLLGAESGQTTIYSWTTVAGSTGRPLAFYTGPSEAMRLDTSGNLGIGTSSPAYKLVVSNGGASGIEFGPAFSGTANLIQSYNRSGGAYVNTVYDAAEHRFNIGGTERARITSGGDFGIGNTNPLYRLTVDKDTTSALAFFTNSNASAPNGLYVDFSAASPNNATQYFLYCEDSTAQRATIRSNGGLANYSGNDVNLSDRREKTNFAPAKSYLDTICAIPVQTFEYIDQSEDDPGLTLGVVAQDVQAVAPELVMESNWGTEDNPKMRLSIYQTDLQYALMKCIQELKAQNDELRARVAALESQP